VAKIDGVEIYGENNTNIFSITSATVFQDVLIIYWKFTLIFIRMLLSNWHGVIDLN